MSPVFGDPVLNELLVNRVARSLQLSLQLSDDFLPGSSHGFVHYLSISVSSVVVSSLRWGIWIRELDLTVSSSFLAILGFLDSVSKVRKDII